MKGKVCFAVRVVNWESWHQITFLVLAQTSTGTQKSRSKFPICTTTQVWFINESNALRHLWIENSTKVPDCFLSRYNTVEILKKTLKLCTWVFSWILNNCLLNSTVWSFALQFQSIKETQQRCNTENSVLLKLAETSRQSALFFCHSNKLQIDESWTLERRSSSPIAWTEQCQLEQVVHSYLDDL